MRVFKLFSKHIVIEDHEKVLNAPVAEGKRVLNMYIGTPNRLKKLAESKTIKLNKPKFRQLLIDTRANSKNQSIFDIHETRDDLFDLIVMSAK